MAHIDMVGEGLKEYGGGRDPLLSSHEAVSEAGEEEGVT